MIQVPPFVLLSVGCAGRNVSGVRCQVQRYRRPPNFTSLRLVYLLQEAASLIENETC